MSRIDLFEAIQTFDQEQAKQLFHTYIHEITTIFDKENATLLHVAANYSNREIVEYYLTQYDLKIQENSLLYTIQQKKIWLNKKDNEGFTCIHYAVFRGNQKLAFFLEQHGADIYSINKQGLTVMHIAAQGDSPVLMYYYLSKGMKISAEDSKGSTALHWACYSGQQNASSALLSWGAEIDRQDFTYGMTPLHLAVMSGNGRIVKKLLIRGCNRSIKNYANKLPIEIARQNEYKNITQMIEDKQGVQQLFNIKTPYRKIDKKTFPFYFFLILFLTNYILNISFVIFKHFPEQCELAFAYLLLGLIVAFLFFSISVRKPGFIEAERNTNQFQMLKRNLPSKICFDCMLLKPERSKHCDICKKCVMVYDHHCPWVANCIGAKNYLLFYSFLIFVWIFMILTIVFQILNLIQVDWSDDSALQIIRMVCIFYGLFCSGLFIFPLTYLLFVQTNNCFTNKTTFQRYSYQAKNQNSEDNSKTQSFTTSIESLQQKLIIKKPSQNLTSQQHPRQIPQKTMVKIKGLNSNYTQNCYNMCWGNANNIIYQYGKLS